MMAKNNKPRLSVSTWSLHRTLGRLANYGPGDERPQVHANGALPLIDLPARLASFGIHTLEICHFHLPSIEASYLSTLCAALHKADIELWSLLIDGGDITHPDYADRDTAWIQGWIDVAGQLGAKNARVIAGKQEPTPAVLAKSRAGLDSLATYAHARGVRLMTENWLTTFATPDIVLSTLAQLEGKVGLCVDFGNWRGPGKYDDLARIMPLGESCHTKASFTGPTELDRTDYERCLSLAQDAGFAGPHTLIYDGPNPDEWAGLALEMAVVRPYLS